MIAVAAAARSAGISPAAQEMARFAARGGVVPSELRGAGSRGLREELELALGSHLDQGEWSQVQRAMAGMLQRAARAASTGSAGSCRRCGQAVRWVETLAGKHLAVNPVPHRRGNVTLVPMGRSLVARVHGHAEIPLEREAYRPHVATCPRAPGRVVEAVKRPTCVVCGLPMDPVLYDLGERDHPTCAPEPPATEPDPGQAPLLRVVR